VLPELYLHCIAASVDKIGKFINSKDMRMRVLAPLFISFVVVMDALLPAGAEEQPLGPVGMIETKTIAEVSWAPSRNGRGSQEKSRHFRGSINWFVVGLSVVALLYGQVCYAAQKTIEWFDAMQCSNKMRFDPKKYDEQILRNTLGAIFPSDEIRNPFPDIIPDISVRLTMPVDEQIERLQQYCARWIQRDKDLPFLALPGIEDYRNAKLEELNEDCKRSEILIRAAYDGPAVLRSHAPSVEKCSRFIDALEGKTDLMAVWEDLQPGNCRSSDKANAGICRDYEQRKARGLDSIRYEVLTLGWSNCAVDNNNIDSKRLEKMQAELGREFLRRFKIKREACSD